MYNLHGSVQFIKEHKETNVSCVIKNLIKVLKFRASHLLLDSDFQVFPTKMERIFIDFYDHMNFMKNLSHVLQVNGAVYSHNPIGNNSCILMYVEGSVSYCVSPKKQVKYRQSYRF